MERNLKKMLKGYQAFRKKYTHGNKSIMKFLSHHGQNPEIMVVACCDSRVDPALILQCDPGDLFVVRNVANIVPPFEKDDLHHGTSAALEFGICYLKVKHLILLGHSQCGGIQTLWENLKNDHSTDTSMALNPSTSNIANLNTSNTAPQNDFITNWVSLIKVKTTPLPEPDDCAKLALQASYQNCLTFPWIKEKLLKQALNIHLWFFDIQTGQIFTYSKDSHSYQPLEVSAELNAE